MSAPSKVPVSATTAPTSATSTTGTTASTTPATATATGTHNHPKFRGFNVPTILSWKNPQRTGTLFGEAVAAWVVLSSSFALRLFLRVTFYFLLLLSVLEASTRFVNGSQNGIIGTYRPSRFLPREQAIQNISASIAKHVRSAIYGIEHLLDTRSPALNFRIAIAAWVVYKILGLVSVRTLALFAIIATFILPVAYLQFKPQVDEAITELQAHLAQQQKKLEKIAHEKAGPQIQFLQKFTNRTASSSARQPGGQGLGAAPAPARLSQPGGVSTGSAPGATTGATSRAIPVSSHTGPSHTSTHSSSGTVPLSASGHSTSGHSTAGHTAGLGGAGLGATTAPGHSSGHSAGLSGTSGLSGATAGHSSGHAAGLGGAAGIPAAGAAVAGSHGSHPSPEEVFSNFSEVPSLAGNVKVDPSRVQQFQTDAQTLRDSIQKDKSFH